jgi:hypothetical protein
VTFVNAPRADGRLLFADLVADDTANRCAAYRPDRTAACQHCTGRRTDASANRGVFLTRRHPAATAQADQYRDGY